MNVCWMIEPSVVASSRLSLSDEALDVTNRTPFTLSASSLIRKSNSAFDSSGTENGSTRCGVIHRPSGTFPIGARLVVSGRHAIVGRGDGDRLARRSNDRVAGDVAGRGKAPRAADKGANADAVRFALGDVGDLTLAGPMRLRQHADDAGVGVDGAGRPGGVERQQREIAFGGVRARRGIALRLDVDAGVRQRRPPPRAPRRPPASRTRAG